MSRSPDVIQLNSTIVPVLPRMATSMNTRMAKTIESSRAPQVTHWAARSMRCLATLSRGSMRASTPAIAAPMRGRRTTATDMGGASAFHQVDVLDRDGATDAEVDDEDGEP